MIDFVATFIFFFAVIDPIGTIPVFIAVTRGFDSVTRKKVAFLATLIATVILILFVIAGELVLIAMRIPLPAFQIAGGLVLFLFALTMIFGAGKPEEESAMVEQHQETAVFPLAVPSIASPGAMLTAVLLTENSRFSYFEQLQTVSMMLLVLLLTLVLMLFAGKINDIIGNAGAIVVSRVMGMILSAVAVTNVLSGIDAYYGL